MMIVMRMPQVGIGVMLSHEGRVAAFSGLRMTCSTYDVEFHARYGLKPLKALFGAMSVCTIL